MVRTRLTTTEDANPLERARRTPGRPDSQLLDEALTAQIDPHRPAEVDARYAAYDTHPLDEPDAWGDLASFRRRAAGAE